MVIPAHSRTGTIEDVEHIVVLMQENRSFDHYFGTLRGVRGFGDSRAVKLANEMPVWYQPSANGDFVLPFRPSRSGMGMVFLDGLDHDWGTTHNAWNQGEYDQWVINKGPSTMTYLAREDIPFHYALADAFTICDAYYCSQMGPTDPNRMHLWTGWAGNDGRGGGPVADGSQGICEWGTFPEVLTKVGIDWKVYQDTGGGLSQANAWGLTQNPAIGNYGDNVLLYFRQYQNSLPGSSLYQRALTGTNVLRSGRLIDEFRKDVLRGTLPSVSYVIAPEAYSEHPNWPANYGAWYIAQFLDALTANPAVWSKTALFLTYDENDGFFDHMVPPTPPVSREQGISTMGTENEIFRGDSQSQSGPYGLGPRVPMLVISPWSRGGYVCSEVFDHTSIIRFIEQRFRSRPERPIEGNITRWRRDICGDLTSAFNFATPNERTPSLPSTLGYKPAAANRHEGYLPQVPADQSPPVQEPGTRPARPLPYRHHVFAEPHVTRGMLTIHFHNMGNPAVFQVRAGNCSLGPWTYSLGKGARLHDDWPITAHNLTGYDLSVYGPNGFFRSFRGSIVGERRANLLIGTDEDIVDNVLVVTLANLGGERNSVRVVNGYAPQVIRLQMAPGDRRELRFALMHSYGWYDLLFEVDEDSSFKYQLAGHLETGTESQSDPAMPGSDAFNSRREAA